MKSKRTGVNRLALAFGVFASISLSIGILLLFLNDFQTLMTFNRPEGGYDSGFVSALAETFPKAGESSAYLLLVNLALAITFTPMGVVIASRQPSNALGWIFCSIGMLVGMLALGDQYTVYSLITNPGSLPGVEWAAWLASWVWMPVMNLTFVWIPALFPNGRNLSRRWSSVIVLNVVGMFLLIEYLAFLPGRISIEPQTENPLGVAFGVLELCLGLGALLGWLTVISAAASLVLRLRLSSGMERQQIKWLAYAVAMAATFLLAGTVVRGAFGLDVAGTILEFVFIPFLPLAIAAAILRYRLYDIDFVINRTIVYSALTLALVGVYSISVVVSEYVLRAVTGGDSQLGIVASTLVIAALFNPLRRLIQRFIDRRFYRRKYDARRTLDEFSARLRDETDLDDLVGDFTGVVSKTLRPEHISVWLAPAERKHERHGNFR